MTGPAAFKSQGVIDQERAHHMSRKDLERRELAPMQTSDHSDDNVEPKRGRNVERRQLSGSSDGGGRVPYAPMPRRNLLQGMRRVAPLTEVPPVG